MKNYQQKMFISNNQVDSNSKQVLLKNCQFLSDSIFRIS